MPTRLLDWTNNPLAALYFATSKEPQKDAELFMIDALALRVNKELIAKNGRALRPPDVENFRTRWQLLHVEGQLHGVSALHHAGSPGSFRSAA
jgi:hypothetical protein